MAVVNLWECMVALSSKSYDGVAKVEEEVLRDLGQAARFHMQEINLAAVPEGWAFRIFSPEGSGQDEICITIPKDPRESVKITHDQVGRRLYLHND